MSLKEAEMGRVLTHAKIENLDDLYEVDKGQRAVAEVRTLEVEDALVDTGATTLALPTRYIQQLGLRKNYDKLATTAGGKLRVNVYQAVRLTLLQDRYCTVDVMEVSDDTPVLIGQIPLEMLDLVVDMQGRRLIGNPAHDGEHILELL